MSAVSQPVLSAVLTSDIVHSTKLSTTQYTKVMHSLKTILDKHLSHYHCQYEIFRGDSFQVLYPDIKVAMNSALSLRLYLQSGIDCPAIKLTQSFAIGSIEQGAHDMNSSLGEAYVISGRALDSAARGDFTVNFGKTMHTHDLSLSSLFLQKLLNGLTEKQSEVLYYYLDANFPEQQTIAQQMGMTRQNIATHLKRSGADLVKAYLLTYRDICAEKIS